MRRRTWVGKTLVYAKFSCTRIINTSDHIVNHFLLHYSRSVLFHLHQMKEENVPIVHKSSHWNIVFNHYFLNKISLDLFLKAILAIFRLYLGVCFPSTFHNVNNFVAIRSECWACYFWHWVHLLMDGVLHKSNIQQK